MLACPANSWPAKLALDCVPASAPPANATANARAETEITVRFMCSSLLGAPPELPYGGYGMSSWWPEDYGSPTRERRGSIAPTLPSGPRLIEPIWCHPAFRVTSTGHGA